MPCKDADFYALHMGYFRNISAAKVPLCPKGIFIVTSRHVEVVILLTK
jgi:hypothetical protein